MSSDSNDTYLNPCSLKYFKQLICLLSSLSSPTFASLVLWYFSRCYDYKGISRLVSLDSPTKSDMILVALTYSILFNSMWYTIDFTILIISSEDINPRRIMDALTFGSTQCIFLLSRPEYEEQNLLKSSVIIWFPGTFPNPKVRENIWDLHSREIYDVTL